MATLFAEDTEERVTEAQNWETRRVETDEGTPDGKARESGSDTENDVETGTSTVSDTGEDEAIEKTLANAQTSQMCRGRLTERQTSREYQW